MKNQRVAAGLGQRVAGAVRQRIGVVGEMDAVRRALLAGHVRRRRPGDQVDLLLLPAHLLDRQARRNSPRRRPAHRRPARRSTRGRARSRRPACSGRRPACTSIGRPSTEPPKSCDRQFGGHAVARSADVAVRPAHVGQQADLDRLGSALRADEAGHGQAVRRPARPVATRRDRSRHAMHLSRHTDCRSA